MKKVGIVVSILTGVGLFFAIAASSASTTQDSEERQSFPNNLTASSTLEEHLKWKEDFYRWAKENGKLLTLSGEETKGREIVIKGQSVKLPPDAFVKAYVVDDENLEQKEGYRIHLPFYAIQRGNSVIMIAENTGYVVNIKLAPGQEKAFDFLQPSIAGILPEVKLGE